MLLLNISLALRKVMISPSTLTESSESLCIVGQEIQRMLFLVLFLFALPDGRRMATSHSL